MWICDIDVNREKLDKDNYIYEKVMNWIDEIFCNCPHVIKIGEGKDILQLPSCYKNWRRKFSLKTTASAAVRKNITMNVNTIKKVQIWGDDLVLHDFVFG